jgi:hypothetical protein
MSTLNDLAEVAFAQGKLDEARTDQERVCAAYEKISTGSADLADCLADLAQVRLAQGDAAHARDAAQRALDLGTTVKASPAVLAPVQFVMAQAMWDTNLHSRAVALARTARAAYDPAASNTFGGRARPGGDKLGAAIDTWLASRAVP